MTGRWERVFSKSANNFDLRLADPKGLDFVRARQLLANILAEKHRGLTLSSRAAQEFRRWFEAPDTPLRSDAYVLLSNWFLTQSGDRQSAVASLCENLWDALFPCRPPDRLSSPEPGRNHVMVPAEFERFWQRLAQAQGADLQDVAGGVRPESNIKSGIEGIGLAPMNGLAADRLRATFEKEGLHVEVEGSPRALADFLKLVSGGETKPGESE
jgi:hypothetical protein